MRFRTLMVATTVALAPAGCDTGEDAELDQEIVEEGVAPPADVAAPGTGAALAIDSLQGAGPYLTDASGRALYLIEGAPQDSATCYDACAEEWPPFLAEGGTPSARGQGVDSTLIGTIQRPDGQTQVTYAGHALYYYHDDTGAGMTSGQDVTDQWGEWYLVTPEGEPLEQEGGDQEG